MSAKGEERGGRWRLDRTVPVALIVTVVLQAGIIVYSLGQQSSELANVRKLVEELRQDRRAEIDRLARMETKQELSTEERRQIAQEVRAIRDLLTAPARSGSIQGGG